MQNDFQALIEETFSLNNNTPVVVVGFSQGALVTLELLARMNDSWKMNYIKSLITVSAPFGGTVLSIPAIISGKLDSDE